MANVCSPYRNRYSVPLTPGLRLYNFCDIIPLRRAKKGQILTWVVGVQQVCWSVWYAQVVVILPSILRN